MTHTLLPLDQWRANIGFNPWLFWGFSHQTYVPLESACNGLVFKYSWQSQDAAGREDILEAIANAESTLATQIALGYAPAPHFLIESHLTPRYPDVTVHRIGYEGADWRWMAIQLNEGKIQKMGVETRTLIGDAAVVYYDADGDGLDDSWSATIPTTVTDAEQIAVYFTDTDRYDSAPVSEEWRIRPVSVTISGGNATITGKAWLMALPALYETPSQASLDPTDASNFVTTVEVYRYYCDPTGSTTDTAAIKLIWETIPHPYWCCCSSCCGVVGSNAGDPAAEAYAMARATLRNAQAGIVGMGEANYNSATGEWCNVESNCRPPDRMIVRYQAGYPTVNGQMELQMQRIVTRFAAAELNRSICACSDAQRNLYQWQFDLAYTGESGEKYAAFDAEDLNNPLGTRRGHAWAWKQIRYLRNIIGVPIG